MMVHLLIAWPSATASSSAPSAVSCLDAVAAEGNAGAELADLREALVNADRPAVLRKGGRNGKAGDSRS